MLFAHILRLIFSYEVDNLAFIWLSNCFGYFSNNLGDFFKSSGHPGSKPRAQILDEEVSNSQIQTP
jgi:hypothetical protein